MPGPSSHFNNLVNSHKVLAETYLPKVASPGIPDPTEQEFTRAFIVLVHAEMEFYFESICKDIVAASEAEFKVGRVAPAALGLITFSGKEARTGGVQLIDAKPAYARKISTRFYEATAAHKKLAEDNNGIRQKYLAPLFVPLGLTQQDIDPIWVTQLDDFAEKRGAYAHKSMTYSEAESKNINPNDEALRVHRLIFDDPRLSNPGLISSVESFDKWAISQTATLGGTTASSKKRHSGVLKRALWVLVDLVDRWEIYRKKG